MYNVLMKIWRDISSTKGGEEMNKKTETHDMLDILAHLAVIVVIALSVVI